MHKVGRGQVEQTKQPRPFTDFQQMDEDKLSQLAVKIANRAIGLIMYTPLVFRDDFIMIHIDPKQEEIAQLDARSSAFFQKVVQTVEKNVNHLYPTLELQLASMKVKDNNLENIRVVKQCLEATALSFVQNLMNEFDGLI